MPLPLNRISANTIDEAFLKIMTMALKHPIATGALVTAPIGGIIGAVRAPSGEGFEGFVRGALEGAAVGAGLNALERGFARRVVRRNPEARARVLEIVDEWSSSTNPTIQKALGAFRSYHGL